jgi:hypothetical protein
VHLVGY